MPPRAEVGLTSGVEVEAFRQLVSNRYHVEFRIVVAADVDHDGDLDVLASTDRSVTLWVNDGHGHLSAHRLPHGPAIEFRGPGNTWRGREDRAEPTIQGDGAPSPVSDVRAHAPPRSGVRCAFRGFGRATARISRPLLITARASRLSSARLQPIV